MTTTILYNCNNVAITTTNPITAMHACMCMFAQIVWDSPVSRRYLSAAAPCLPVCVSVSVRILCETHPSAGISLSWSLMPAYVCGCECECAYIVWDSPVSRNISQLEPHACLCVWMCVYCVRLTRQPEYLSAGAPCLPVCVSVRILCETHPSAGISLSWSPMPACVCEYIVWDSPVSRNISQLEPHACLCVWVWVYCVRLTRQPEYLSAGAPCLPVCVSVRILCETHPSAGISLSWSPMPACVCECECAYIVWDSPVSRNISQLEPHACLWVYVYCVRLTRQPEYLSAGAPRLPVCVWVYVYCVRLTRQPEYLSAGAPCLPAALGTTGSSRPPPGRTPATSRSPAPGPRCGRVAGRPRPWRACLLLAWWGPPCRRRCWRWGRCCESSCW